jgi:hypothetical protein
MRASLNAGPQPGQFGHLCVNDLHPPFQRQRVVAAGGVKVHVHAVLASLGLDRHVHPAGSPGIRLRWLHGQAVAGFPAELPVGR